MASKATGKRSRQEVFVDFENFVLGLWSLQDTTKSPFGSARLMRNMQVTDRGGIAPRPGTQLLGTKNTAGYGVKGLYNFRKSFDADEFLIKAYDDELEVYSKNHSSADWFRLKNGFSSDKEFGFATSLVNTDSEDFCVFCNRYDPYQKWTGSMTKLAADVAAAASVLTVDSVLTSEIFESKTANASSATTLDAAGTPWADDMWIGYYVYIKTGTHAGKIRLISDNDNNTITFATLGSDPGSCDFEIRRAAFPATGTLIFNGSTLAYSAIPTHNTFTVSNSHAASSGQAVALVPTEYKDAPRGNRITNYLGRIIVGNVRSAVARGSGGALQGYASGGSYFVSKINNPTDFGYTATRVAGEGDIIGTPYGGGEISDVQHQEDAVYIFKPRYIEAARYSQDSDDIIVREPLKAMNGARVPTIKGADDIYMITPDNKFTSLGRVESKDVTVQTANIGYKIKRLLDTYVFDFGRGIEDKDKIFIPAKSSSAQEQNDVIVVYNKVTDSFWGVWDIPANFLERFNEKLYYGDSVLPNVYEMFVGHADVDGTDRFPITAEYATHFMNLTPSDGNLQAVNGMYIEGYISAADVISFKMYKDFNAEPFMQFDFSGSEEQFQAGQALTAYFGGEAVGLAPIGALGEELEDGRRHFMFRVYFPFQYGNHFSVGFGSSGADYDYEVTRMGLLLKTTVTQDATKVKIISE